MRRRVLMKILVIGGGGREHALVWKLAQSPRASKIWCAPGNAGIADETLAANGMDVECIGIGAEDLPSLLKFSRDNQVDLTVVGPDNPLAMGIVDQFKTAGLRAWGPTQQAAQFESSKIFSQEFMDRNGVPTMKSGSFTAADKAKAFTDSLGGKCAVKADGLALGKGVLICNTPDEANKAIDRIMTDRAFGDAGSSVLIQELITGMEVSLHALCDGKTAKLFPSSQDHKRALDGDQGLNTGGMGTYSPVPFLSDNKLDEIANAIIEPWLAGCAAEGIDFRGMLYPGIMLTDSGPKVLEFNARFGDPETQVYLTRLKNDLVDLLEASIDGTLDQQELHWSNQSAVCVVIASGGYPGSYEKGKVITGIADADALQGVKVFHAGTKIDSKNIVNAGGRVLGVTALGQDLEAARNLAYEATAKIHFDGAFARSDIAAKGL
ncbi:MAG: phosphoribosylamine--glycine ligase [Verrucomicrobiota bacterium]|nr:phosphoribosylamine--glycine ligase [Verrucomicrobiota bacterium]